MAQQQRADRDVAQGLQSGPADQIASRDSEVCREFTATTITPSYTTPPPTSTIAQGAALEALCWAPKQGPRPRNAEKRLEFPPFPALPGLGGNAGGHLQLVHFTAATMPSSMPSSVSPKRPKKADGKGGTAGDMDTSGKNES